MRIRAKIILIVLPLLITGLVLTGVSSALSARTGITRIATEFLEFKAQELSKYAESQWNLLVQNDMSDQSRFVDLTKAAVGSFAASIIRSETELILAVDSQGNIAMATVEIMPSAEESAALAGLFDAGAEGWLDVSIGGVARKAHAVRFAPFEWLLLVTEETDSFYGEVNSITYQSAVILAGAIVLSVVVLLLLVGYITRPLSKVVRAMQRIIATNDMSSRVDVEYRDEIGDLAHTFNLMVGQLEVAYGQIKRYAFQAVLVQKKEQKIRHIFQKYVPKDVIDRFFSNPESMLVGEDRYLCILFSDIRDFTTISESLMPDELVNSLNRYFSIMVDIIAARNGVIDKYIGDAIMAFFGAPVKHDDDALQSVLAGTEMSDSLEDFNTWQRENGKPEFRIGVGLNYGIVTVGNIGSDKKMDYTVIGDSVNIASRCEGLTKMYKVPLVYTESVQEKVKDHVESRFLDTVAVKGKTIGLRVYTARKELSPAEAEAWGHHNEGMDLYYQREFATASTHFRQVLSILPKDHTARIFVSRCSAYTQNPPPEDWSGIEVLQEK